MCKLENREATDVIQSECEGLATRCQCLRAGEDVCPSSSKESTFFPLLLTVLFRPSDWMMPSYVGERGLYSNY